MLTTNTLQDLITKSLNDKTYDTMTPKEIAGHFHFDFDSTNFSVEQLKTYLKQQMQELATGNSVNREYFKRLCKHFTLTYLLDKTSENENTCRIALLAEMLLKDVKRFTANAQAWEKVFRNVTAWQRLDTYNPLDLVFIDEEQALAKSIRYMRERNFDVKINNGYIEIDQDTHRRIATAIDKRMERIGEKSLNNLQSIIHGLFEPNLGRYRFIRIERQSLPPIGYLFNLAIKHINKPIPRIQVGLKNSWKDIVTLSTHYCTLLEIQERSKYGNIFHTSDSILSYIYQMVLSDQIFELQQHSPATVLKITKSLYSKTTQLSLNLPWTFEEYFTVAEAILDICSASSTPKRHIIHAQHIHERLRISIKKEKLIVVLDALSNQAGKVNNRYLLPFDVEKVTCFDKPLIKHSNDWYVVYDPYFFFIGFYEVLSSTIRGSGVKDNEIGFWLEEVVSEMFKQANITFHPGGKFKITREQQKYFNNKKQEGECDFIIETDDTIVIIELKKKVLTKIAQSGNTDKILSDWVKSFLQAHIQANCIEVLLRKYGKIAFKSGYELPFKDRKIVKVSLSMFDFKSLQDKSVNQQLLKSLMFKRMYRDTATPTENELLDEINKHLAVLSNQYQLTELQYSISNANGLSNSHYISLFLLSNILQKCSSTADFVDALSSIERSITAEKDPYKEFDFLWKLHHDAL